MVAGRITFGGVVFGELDWSPAVIEQAIDRVHRGSRELDARASGPLPRDRVRPPAFGDRCPRCHSNYRGKPCLLCNPRLVPAQHGGHAITDRRDASIIAARLPAPLEGHTRSGGLVARRRGL